MWDITGHVDRLRGVLPLLHRFEVEGQAVSSELVIEALSMQLMDERAGRFERVRTVYPTLKPAQCVPSCFLLTWFHLQVAQHRCYSIMPVVEGEDLID